MEPSTGIIAPSQLHPRWAKLCANFASFAHKFSIFYNRTNLQDFFTFALQSSIFDDLHVDRASILLFWNSAFTEHADMRNTAILIRSFFHESGGVVTVDLIFFYAIYSCTVGKDSDEKELTELHELLDNIFTRSFSGVLTPLSQLHEVWETRLGHPLDSLLTMKATYFTKIWVPAFFHIWVHPLLLAGTDKGFLIDEIMNRVDMCVLTTDNFDMYSLLSLFLATYRIECDLLPRVLFFLLHPSLESELISVDDPSLDVYRGLIHMRSIFRDAFASFVMEGFPKPLFLVY